MKIGKFPKEISRKYLRMASVYRRFAERNRNYSFSMEALIECYRHETFGGPLSPNNGFAIGKRWKDLTISTWREDISKGDFCKAEFITPLSRWYAAPALDTLSPVAIGMLCVDDFKNAAKALAELTGEKHG